VKVNVTTQEQLIACLETKTSFRLAPTLTTVELPHSPTLSIIIPIIEALNNNDTVTCLSIGARQQWSPNELNELVTCLTGLNKGIVKISFAFFDFDPSATEAIVRILKENRRIKTIEILSTADSTSIDGFKIFCDNMEHFKFEEIAVSNAFLPVECLALLLDSLKANQSIKKIKFTEAKDTQGDWFTKLCKLLVLKEMTEFDFAGQVTDYKALKEVLKANHIQKFTLEGKYHPLYINLIANELKLNTSLTDLTLLSEEAIDWKIVGNIITENKNIKRLELRDVNYRENVNVSFLNLGSNTTLTELILDRRTNMDYSTLFSELFRNQTLKKLGVLIFRVADSNEEMQKYLTTTKSLREIEILSPSGDISYPTFIAIIEAVKVNRTIRKLTLKLSRISYTLFSKFIDALKLNTTLTELHLSKVCDIVLISSPINGKRAEDFFMDLLKTNKTLRFIKGASEHIHLEERLKENRDTQYHIINDMCLLFKMILAKPHQFVLPLEIWLQISEHVADLYVGLSEFFRNEINKRM
jgi:hypothetical protein